MSFRGTIGFNRGRGSGLELARVVAEKSFSCLTDGDAAPRQGDEPLGRKYLADTVEGRPRCADRFGKVLRPGRSARVGERLQQSDREVDAVQPWSGSSVHRRMVSPC